MKKLGIAVMLGVLVCSLAVAQGKTKLVLWDQFYRDAETEVMNDIVAKFQAENPNITIERSTKTLDDLKLTLKMAVESGNGPDVMQVNQGEADMGAFVKAGLLVDLTDTAKAKKWDTAFSPSAMISMGYRGKVYGVSTTAEVVGFYYNKTVFEKLGLKVPQTFAELETLLAAVKKAGLTPINFGNLDGWTGIHEWSGLQHVMASRSDLDNMMSVKPGKFWLADSNKKAAEKLQAWVKAGYYSKNFSAIGYDDSTSVFMRGDSALMFTGNWLQGEFAKNPDFKVGFFLMPAEKGVKVKAVGGPGIPFCVSSKSKNKDAAIKFLDFLARKENAKLWASKVMLPAAVISDAEAGVSDPLFKDIMKAYKTVVESNGVGYYIDWVTPTFYDTCSSSVQKLMALELAPDAFVKNLDADYQKFVASGK